MDIELVISAEAPFEVDGLILEEDTGMALSADMTMRDVHDNHFKLMMDMWQFEEGVVGTAQVKGTLPVRIFAIVHDLDAEITCRKEWVVYALEESLLYCATMKLSSVGIQPLGCVHGRLDREWFIGTLKGALSIHQGDTLQRVWLCV